jgi:hypothetical protein
MEGEVEALREPVVDRKDVVLRGFEDEEPLQLVQLLRLLRGEILRLALGRKRSIGGTVAPGSVAVNVVKPTRGRSGIGSTSRGRSSRCAVCSAFVISLLLVDRGVSRPRHTPLCAMTPLAPQGGGTGIKAPNGAKRKLTKLPVVANFTRSSPRKIKGHDSYPPGCCNRYLS